MNPTNHLLRNFPVAVIGAGPVGLAAAAHLLARGMTPVVLEAGCGPATHLESYRHVGLYSPWHYDIDPAAAAMLATAGWRAPDPDALPTAGELIDAYLAPLAALPVMAPVVRFNHRVTRITRYGHDKVSSAERALAPFLLRADTPDGSVELFAAAVIDATGTWARANPLGANGVAAPGEDALVARIAHGMPDIARRQRQRYAGQHVLVVGAGHSAAGNLLALAELAEQHPGTRISWAVRGRNLDRVFGGGSADQLPARGALGARLKALRDAGRLDLHTGFRIASLHGAGQAIDVVSDADGVIEGVDAIIGATGSRPDLGMTRELRVRLDPCLESAAALAALIDPNLHSCGTVAPHGHRELAHPEPGYYAVGAKSYGRAPNFLMHTGYEQVRSVVAALAGDMAAADKVRLALPATGVCSGPASNCCGGPAPSAVSACCALDAVAKVEGKSGCGCAPTASSYASCSSQ